LTVEEEETRKFALNRG